MEFPNQFIGDNCDRDILSKITTENELSGLLNLVIPALKRLLEVGEYSYDLSPEQVMRMYKINSDPIAAFADECILYSEDNTPKSLVYNEYIVWCQDHSIGPKAENIFGKRFKKMGYEDSKVGSDGNRQRVWKNCVISANVRVPDFNPDVNNQEQEDFTSKRPSSNSYCSNMQNGIPENHTHTCSYNVTIGKKPGNPDVNKKIDSEQSVQVRPSNNSNMDVTSEQSKTADDRVGGVRPQTRAFLQELLTKPMSRSEAVEACRTHGIANPKGPIEFLMGTSKIIETPEGMLRWV